MTQTGSLCVVGLGPGTSALLTGQAQAALQGADVIIGYDGYFQWIADLVRHKECIALPLTQEVARAQLAVERALAGQAVSVISSGDDVVVIPGVSAVNACAALLGAPIAHDFAVLSLSDLLTPWAVIEKRLAAAAEADFVMVLLNPKSARRQWQFARACALIGQHRTPETPVGLVRNAYRPDQAVVLTTVSGLADTDVDMLTTVIVGNSQTRCFQSRLITPRGYMC